MRRLPGDRGGWNPGAREIAMRPVNPGAFAWCLERSNPGLRLAASPSPEGPLGQGPFNGIDAQSAIGIMQRPDHRRGGPGGDHAADGLRLTLVTPLIDGLAAVAHGGHGAGDQSQAGGHGMTINLGKRGSGTAARAAGALMANSLVPTALNCPLFLKPERICLLTISY